MKFLAPIDANGQLSHCGTGLADERASACRLAAMYGYRPPCGEGFMSSNDCIDAMRRRDSAAGT
jgi:hypothetical protein